MLTLIEARGLYRAHLKTIETTVNWELAHLDLRGQLDAHHPVYRAKAKASAKFMSLLNKYTTGMTPVPDDPGFRVGWFWSSSDPTLRVRCLIENTAKIAEMEVRPDFIEWIPIQSREES